MIEAKGVPGGTSLRIRVQPRAARDEVMGERAGALLVRLAAPPVEGRANAALVRLLARRLGLPPSAIEIVLGGSGRDKVVHVARLDPAAVLARLAAPAKAPSPSR
jgi:uncharacterized protein (TIGR00251 family)